MKNLCGLFLIVFSIIPAAAHAGAWLQNEGEGQVITSLGAYTTSTFVDSRGQSQPSKPFYKYELSPYAEYGLRDWLTIGADFDIASVTNNATDFNGITKINFSYAEIFARTYLYHDDKWALSIEPGIDFPQAINEDLNSDGSSPIPEIKLNAGRNFQLFGYDDFADIGVQYRMRDSGGLNDMVKSEATLGLGVSYDKTILLQVFCTDTLGGVDGGSSGNYNVTRPEISYLYQFHDNMTSQVGVYADLYGRNTGAGYGIVYSFWYKF